MQLIPSWESNPTIRVQNLDEAVCTSHNANNFGKGINLILLLPLMIVFVLFYGITTTRGHLMPASTYE